MFKFFKLPALVVLLALGGAANAQISVDIGLPVVDIGVDVPTYPNLVQVPGYPVYYAPNLASNYFFYDGMYWAYQGGSWYSASWYNGPWNQIGPDGVPLFILRVPVSYYRQPPDFFLGWQGDAPPRWGDHWGGSWQGQHAGWDQWNHAAVPTLAPLPSYQRQYSGAHYPAATQQRVLLKQSYHYQPQDATVKAQFDRQASPRAAAPETRVARPAPAKPVPLARPTPEHEAPANKPERESDLAKKPIIVSKGEPRAAPERAEDNAPHLKATHREAAPAQGGEERGKEHAEDHDR